ncbi:MULTISPECIES: prepilin peptidase [unclassified Bosea (in: a-proteobacteria)]|uniref:A24 family peptidase n=1 Tax=unclassified Bosea (in: a-proteobacteria) TaxID=2653178 RepID=UPI000F762DAA|nr:MULTISPECIES: prepilin peptidase [unclassified Bosea (in: a-proteobacteria)]AZO79753.1 peptidase [Bosea sp. Tri-49]RXT15993.1 peptidase [Bosea sp. Tri-39]RXT39685.1 peptidase [Bosea sp. Tri-54]
MTIPLLLILVVFPAAMAYAAASDIVSMTISNRLCLVLAASFAVCAVSVGLTWSQLGWHVAAGLLVLAVCFGFFAAGWIGGGDAKLAAVTALWFGFDQLLPYILISSFAGGALTLGLLQLRKMPLPRPAMNWDWALRLHDKDEGVPYGVALAFAALVVLPETAIWRAAVSA